MASDEILRLWWIPLAVAIVAGLAVAGILAIFLKPVRERFWKPLGRALRWPFSLRLITTHRLKVLSDERESLLREVFDAHSQGDRTAAGAKQGGIAAGRAQALAAVEAERSVPLLKPNWKVARVEANRRCVLRNTQQNSTASDVSITASATAFTFDADTQWPGTFDQMVHFQGAPTSAGRKTGVEFVVRYRDGRGDWQEQQAFLDRVPARASRVL